jgi:APA family basic amino acid/polyamine antiporter
LSTQQDNSPKLVRELGLFSLVATGICSMLGASIYVVPFMIQKHVPGIGEYVLPAFIFAGVPAILAGLCYAILSSAMPRAGGSFLYASRGLSPYLGFIASFSQWFGLSIVIGVIAYIVIPFIRDIAVAAGNMELELVLSDGSVRVGLALLLIWLFVWVNIRGSKAYTATIIPLLLVMFGLGFMVIVAGYAYNHQDFYEAMKLDSASSPASGSEFNLMTFLSAAALLFASFIGFDSIAQAGGEAKNPSKNIPLAIGITLLSVSAYYVLFTSAVYHAVPYAYVAKAAMEQDVSAPSLLSGLLPTWVTIAIMAGAAIALINDLPAMILSVSRLVYAWSEDHIFPEIFSKTHKTHKTPYNAIILSGVIASVGVLGSHFAGDFFLGIDIMVTSMLVNFLLMTITVLTLPQVNPAINSNITTVKNPTLRKWIGILGTFFLSFFLIIHIYKDLNTTLSAWYFHATPIWLIVIALASAVYFYKRKKWQQDTRNTGDQFQYLPD